MPLILLLVLLIGLPACQSSADATAPADTTARAPSATATEATDSLHVIRIPRLDAYTWPEGGLYYAVDMESVEHPTAHPGEHQSPEELLRDLRREGVQVTHGWYRVGASSCSPPGSMIAMDVIVPEQLLLRTAAPWPEATEHGFTPTDAPHIQCPYDVTLYAWR